MATINQPKSIIWYISTTIKLLSTVLLYFTRGIPNNIQHPTTPSKPLSRTVSPLFFLPFFPVFFLDRLECTAWLHLHNLSMIGHDLSDRMLCNPFDVPNWCISARMQWRCTSLTEELEATSAPNLCKLWSEYSCRNSLLSCWAPGPSIRPKIILTVFWIFS